MIFKRITDPSFKYTNAAETDLAKTFRRIRKEQEQRRKAELEQKVQPIRKVAK